MTTNAQILSAVINRWIQPAIAQILSSKMSSMPFLSAFENKIRSTGWVGPNWSLGAELSPIMPGISNAIVQPFVMEQLSRVPDSSIPKMAHSIVDEALKHGKLSLFDGNVIFEVEDLIELKNLLSYNLPIKEEDVYNVITEEPKSGGMESE